MKMRIGEINLYYSQNEVFCELNDYNIENHTKMFWYGFLRQTLNLVKTYHELQKLLFKASVYFIYTYFHHFS